MPGAGAATHHVPMMPELPADLPAERPTVVLLHGLGRTPRAMWAIERAARARGYRVLNLGYASRRGDVAQHAATVAATLRDSAPSGQLHFVTHSLGGIVLRQAVAAGQLPAARVARVVMLAPPNGGSELVDRLGTLSVFGWINGPAGRQLGTGADGLPSRLGAAHFPLGVIAGDWSWNPVYSAMIPGADDGKVSVERARVDGMADFLVVPHGHTFLMSSPDVIAQVIHFLRNGRFAVSDPVAAQ